MVNVRDYIFISMILCGTTSFIMKEIKHIRELLYRKNKDNKSNDDVEECGECEEITTLNKTKEYLLFDKNENGNLKLIEINQIIHNLNETLNLSECEIRGKKQKEMKKLLLNNKHNKNISEDRRTNEEKETHKGNISSSSESLSSLDSYDKLID